MFPEQDQRPHTRGLPRVLFIAPQPHPDDDRVGIPLYSERTGGHFLRDYMNSQEAEFRWYLTTAVRCCPGLKANGEYQHPSAKQQQQCVANELPRLLDQIQPDLIVCLGGPTIKGVLGKSAPSSLSRAINGLFSILHKDKVIPVIVHKDPILHSMWQKKVPQGQDLSSQYVKLFRRINKIAKEGAQRECYDYTLIDTAIKMDKLSQSLGLMLSIDWEYAASELIPGMRTIWHPESHGLCVALTDRDKVTKQLRNFIVVPHLCRRADLWKPILMNRIWVGQNLKTEIQCFWRYAKLDVYDCVDESLKINGRYQIHDLMLWCFGQDHGRMDVGLKKQVNIHLDKDDWGLEVDHDIAEENDRIALLHKEARANIKAQARLSTDVELPWAARQVIADQIEQLRENYRDLPPEGSAHYGHATREHLFEYNAGDTQNSYELAEKQIELGWEPEEPLAELYQRALFVTSMVEREGLPVSKQRFDHLQKATRMKYLHYTRELLKFPQVRKVLREDEKLRKEKAAGLYDTEVLFKYMSPKRPSFLHQLARETGVYDDLPRTKKINKRTGQPGITLDILVLEDLSGGEASTKEEHKRPTWTAPENKSDVQKIWTYVWALRQLFDLRNNFIKNMDWYTVDGHVRPDFRLAKAEVESAQTADDAVKGTSTGRLASVKINAQNIKDDPFLRWIFTSRVYGDDWFLFEADYDRIEPVCLTVVAKIARWKQVFDNGWDLYKIIANEIYHCGVSLEGTVEEVHKRLEDYFKGPRKVLRENAKTRTLAIMYGESPRAFAARSNIPLEEAQEFFARFDEMYPEIVKYKENIKWIVRARELVWSPFGRPRQFAPNLSPTHPNYRRTLNDALLQAINYPIQSMASDITLWKMYEVYRYLKRNNLLDRVRLINLVHDSGWFACHKSVGAHVMAEIQRIMEDMSTLPIDFGVPLKCAFKLGFCLGEPDKVEPGSGMNELKVRGVDAYKVAVEKLFQRRAELVHAKRQKVRKIDPRGVSREQRQKAAS